MKKLHRFPFIQVDAFTDRPLRGNPCAIVFDADELDILIPALVFTGSDLKALATSELLPAVAYYHLLFQPRSHQLLAFGCR